MDESTVKTITLAVHILSIVIVACTVTMTVALVAMSRAIERWLPTLAVFAAARFEGAERD